MSDSVRPHKRQPTRLPYPWDSPGKNTGVGCHFLFQCMKVKSESEIAQTRTTLATPWTAAYQAPVSMGFSRQKYWSGVPLPSPSFVTRELQIKHKRDTPAYLFKWLSCGEKKTKTKNLAGSNHGRLEKWRNHDSRHWSSLLRGSQISQDLSSTKTPGVLG